MPPEIVTESKVVGGPGDPATPIVTPAAPAAVVVTPPVESKKVFTLGSKVFESQEEASKYVASLETQRVDESLRSRVQENNPTAELIDGKPIIDVLLENPERVISHTVQKTLNAVKAQNDDLEKGRRMWDTFYTKNPDLRGKKVILDSILAKNIKEWAKLSEEDGMKMLAQTTREEIRAMGFEPGVVTELPTREAATIGASGSPVVTTPTTTPPAALNMYEQVKAMQAKRKASQVK